MAPSSSPPRILEARARHRVVVSYAVDPDRVAPHLPSGLTPDIRNGRAFVSLVGVELVRVRVLGLPGPGFRRVPAVEMQVPVQEVGASRRGTTTVQAFVPRRLVAWGARLLYGESVSVASMQPIWKEQADSIQLTYRFDWAGREQRVRVVGTKPPVTPAPETPASFLLDRGWRFGARTNGSVVRARSERPVEPVYRVREHHVTIQWASVYGKEWGFLSEVDPVAVLLTPGAPLTLYWREVVK
jgi:uncharacterized protein YqjF (DUF2071 family)